MDIKEGVVDFSRELTKVWPVGEDRNESPLALVACAYDGDPRTGRGGEIKGYRPVYSEEEYEAVLDEALKRIPDSLKEKVLRAAAFSKEICMSAMLDTDPVPDMDRIVPYLSVKPGKGRNRIIVPLTDIERLKKIEWSRIAELHGKGDDKALLLDAARVDELEKLLKAQDELEKASSDDKTLQDHRHVEPKEVSADKSQETEEVRTIETLDGVRAGKAAEWIIVSAERAGDSTTGYTGVGTAVRKDAESAGRKTPKPSSRKDGKAPSKPEKKEPRHRAKVERTRS